MKIFKDIIQGSEEWFALRVGKVTMSNLDKIITPAKGEPSKSQDAYMYKLLAELFYGHPLDTFTSPAMQEGIDGEDEAAKIYAVENDCFLEKVGFVTDDEGTIGCSPDRFIVGANKAVEIKVPEPQTHVKYLDTKNLDREYWAQLQGQLWICELDKVDIYSYNKVIYARHGAERGRVQIEVGRDEEFIKKAQTITGEFLERFQEEKRKFQLN